ncbi:hypothetical protein ACEQ8H_000175 [Pleosporales sp. CAS-2024a]
MAPNQVSLAFAFATCPLRPRRSSLTIFKMHTSAQGNISGNSGAGTQSTGFTSRNPFAALGAMVDSGSDSSASSDIVSSSGASLTTAPREHGSGGPNTPKSSSSQHMSRMSINTINMPTGYASPAHQPMAASVHHNSSPPTRLTRNAQRLGTPRGVSMNQRGNMQASPTARRGSSRTSFSSHLRAPTTVQYSHAASLTGVPELCAVQEMAFRQGQQGRGVSRERVPPSPFAKHFDQVWTQFYLLGKECGGMPFSSSTTAKTSEHANFPWAPLINPYTQDLEHPNGAIDSEWVRKVCIMALDGMAALIGTVCRRQGEWRKTVCDVPAQIKQALMQFEDLRNRYERLQQDAREAVAGGLPYRY